MSKLKLLVVDDEADFAEFVADVSSISSDTKMDSVLLVCMISLVGTFCIS